jgi:hypothetical protein
MVEREVREAFGPARSDELACLADLYGTYAFTNPVYTEDQMAALKEMRIPPKVLSFYRSYDPKSLPMFDCYVSLLGLPVIRDWNATAEPSVFLTRFGLVTFAVTVGGHSVCMDLNQVNADEPRVILVDQRLCYYDMQSRSVEWGGLPEKVYEEFRSAGKSVDLSYELIARCCPEIAPTFSEFLRKLAEGEYEDLEAFLR